jgi:hypothetical protein
MGKINHKIKLNENTKLLKPIKDLFKTKGSNIAILMGCGPSINEITEDIYTKIKKYDIWTLNNFIYHNFIIPNYYYLELKKYNFDNFKQRMEEKRKLYKNVKFIIRNKKSKNINAIGRNHRYVYGYDYTHYRSHDNALANITVPIDANYKMSSDILTKSYDMSLSIILEILYKMEYQWIILIGVDLETSYYFWSDRDPKWGAVCHYTNKEHEGKDPNLPHATANRCEDFVYDFNTRFMKPLNKEIFVGTKNTLLYPKLRYVKI